MKSDKGQIDSVSALANKIADETNTNVTVVRDILENVRRELFRLTKQSYNGFCGWDMYGFINRSDKTICDKLPKRTRKPVRKPAKRRAGK